MLIGVIPEENVWGPVNRNETLDITPGIKEPASPSGLFQPTGPKYFSARPKYFTVRPKFEVNNIQSSKIRKIN